MPVHQCDVETGHFIQVLAAVTRAGVNIMTIASSGVSIQFLPVFAMGLEDALQLTANVCNPAKRADVPSERSMRSS